MSAETHQLRFRWCEAERLPDGRRKIGSSTPEVHDVPHVRYSHSGSDALRAGDEFKSD